ncbi:hypothetical protein EDD16DRAFT_1528681 [Pisolithus croceorrhizus]|nr:hypothetical protein EDD16DRAFT_1528681 [Pisolithus croceorrhizus]KAI6137514.1 hypothetical protein EDD17DRAFT_1517248 [Pisolithus thermaeus]
MFETSACKLAATKIVNGLDGPYTTWVLKSLSDGDTYFMLKATGLTFLRMQLDYFLCLVDKQKKVEIDSYQALLNYWLSFTDITAQLRISSQLSWIEKDDLFLEGFDQEFRHEILRRLKWNNRRQYVDDPWPTYQDSLKPTKVPGVGLRSQAVEVDGIEVATAELSSSALVEG